MLGLDSCGPRWFRKRLWDMCLLWGCELLLVVKVVSGKWAELGVRFCWLCERVSFWGGTLVVVVFGGGVKGKRWAGGLGSFLGCVLRGFGFKGGDTRSGGRVLRGGGGGPCSWCPTLVILRKGAARDIVVGPICGGKVLVDTPKGDVPECWGRLLSIYVVVESPRWESVCPKVG